MTEYGSIGVSLKTSRVLYGTRLPYGTPLLSSSRRMLLYSTPDLAPKSYKTTGIVQITQPRGVLGIVSKYSVVYRQATWKFDYVYNRIDKFPHPDTTGHIEGTVKVEGVIWANVVVRLYYNVNGLLICVTKSDNSGHFRFDNLEVGKGYYSVTAYHEGFNAVIYDQIRPVNDAGVIPPEYVPPPPLELIWSPVDITTALILDAEDITKITSDADGISQISDKSGNTRHATQAVSTKRPSLVGKYMLFDETDEELSIASPILTTQSIFIVLETTDNQFLVFGSGSDSYYGLCGENSVSAIGTMGSPTYRVNGVGVGWLDRSHVLASLSSTGINIVEIVGAALTSWPGLRLNYVSGGFPQYSFLGKIYDVVMVSGTPSASDRERLEGYFAWKHGITSKLPSDHTYKTRQVFRYVSKFPVTFDSTTVKTSSEYGGTYKCYNAFNYNLPLTGDFSQFVNWIASPAIPIKLSVDLGSAIAPARLLITNSHHSGTTTDSGANLVRVYGTNSSVAFANTDATNIDNLTLIAEINVPRHPDGSDSPVINSFTLGTDPTTYRYMVFRILSSYGNPSYVGVRRIEIQYKA